MATRMVSVLMLVCLSLPEGTLGDYGFGGVSRPKIIIKPAGPSKQHPWVGHGGYGVNPQYIPRPMVIPKWNVMDPSYTAFWIANTPAPTKTGGNSQGSKFSGFGPPKQNSIISGSVASGSSYAKPAASAPVLAAALPVLRGPPPHSPLPLASTSAPSPNLTSPPAPIGSNSQIKASPPASKTPSSTSDSSYSQL